MILAARQAPAAARLEVLRDYARRFSGRGDPPVDETVLYAVDLMDRAKALRLEHDGRTYYFCSEHCMNRFAAERGRPAGEPHHAAAHR